MPSIGSKDSSSESIELRNREQIRELKSQHAQEVSKLKTEYEARIESLQESSAEKLSAKDMQHQKEIEALRAFYQKRNRP